ncbi:MAG TPA: gliding motility-associated C-terminal domain-containing protein [Flavobacterium sp.]
MEIFTFCRNKILILCLIFFGSIYNSNAQCPTVADPTQSFCDLQSPTVASLSATNNGGGLAWFATATSTTPLNLGTALVNGEDYFADNSSGNCGSRQSVVVTIFGPPSGSPFGGVCKENPADAIVSLLDVYVSGNNIRWYTTSSGGIALDPNTILVDGTIYYASQTNPETGCETSRHSLFVNVGIVPTPTGDPTQEFCDNPSDPAMVSDLDASGNNNWYLTSTSTSVLAPNTLLIDGQSYFATTTDPPCESSTRFEVVVTLSPISDAGSNGSVSLCENQLSSSPPLSLFDALGGSPQEIGVWTGPFATTGGHEGILDVSVLTLAGSPYVFTYSVTSGVCSPNSSTVTITVIPPPNAGANGTLTLCSNASPVNLFASLGGTPQTGGAWTPALSGGNGVFNPAVNAAGVYTYTVTGTSPCANATATVTVTVVPEPVAGNNATLNICSNAVAQDLFPLLGNTAQTGGVWTPALASGTGFFNPAVDPAGTYTYTVTGTAPCANDSATVTVTKIPSPNAGTNGTLTLCSNSSSANLFASLGGTPQAGGTWSPALSGGIFNPAVNAPGVYTYTVAGTAPCPNATASVTVSVVPEPIAGNNATLNICSNAAAQNLFPLLGNTAQTGGIWTPALASGTGVFNPAVDPAGTYTYTVTGTAPCSNDSATVTVTKIPPPNAGTNGTLTLCSNSPSANLFASLGGTPQAGGTWSPALSGGIFNPAVNVPGVYTYTVAGTAPCPNATASVTVSVVPEPIAGNNATLNICSNAAAQNLFPLLGNTAQTGGIWTPALASGTGVFNPAVDPAGTYTYTVTGTAPCANDTATVTVTKIPPPNAGTNGTLNLCSNSPSTNLFSSLGGTPQTGGTWVPALAGGNGIFNPAVDAPGVYTYTVAGVAPCGNATATVTVSIVPEPVAGTNATLNLCSTAAAQNLFPLLGSTAQSGGSWTPALASGTGVFNPAVDPAGTYTYTVTGTAPCANDTATVTITIIPPPNSGADGSLILCSNSPATNLFASLGGNPQTGGTWSPALAGGNGIFNPAVDAPGVYTYTVTGVAPCGNASATVAVSIVPEPVAGTNASLNLCSTAAAQDLFPLLGNTAQTGGFWTPNLASGTGFYNPAVDPAGTYTYTVTGTAPCANDTATVTITIIPPPNAGTNGTVMFCSNSPATNLYTSLGGTPQTGGVWSPVLSGGNGIFNPAIDAPGVYTYTVTGVAPCGVASATVTVSIVPEPIAGNNAILNLCSTAGTQDLFPLLGNTAQTGGVWTPALASGTGVFNPAIDPAGTYTYTVIGTPPCANDFASVSVTFIQPPNAGTNETLNLCSNSPATDLFTSLGGTPQTGGIWSPVLSGGNGTFNPAIDAPGVYTYTVSGVAPCENASATVTVSIVPEPVAGNNATLNICSNEAAQDLFPLLGDTAQTGGVWTPVLASGTGVFNPAVDPAGTYIYTAIGTAPCADDTASVTVTLIPPPNAGVDGTAEICSNANPQDLFTLLGPTAQPGGTWFPALSSTIGIFNPEVDAAGVYTYTVTGNNACGADTATITVTIIPGPDAGQNGAVTMCENSLSQNLFNYLNGTPLAGGTWSPALASGTGVFNPAVDAPGVYTYTFVGNQPCDNDTATVTVTVNPEPNAGEDGTAFFCSNYAPSDLFLNLSGTPQPGGTWSPALSSGTGVFNPLVDSPGTYTYSVGGNLCTTDTAVVVVTVVQSPNAGGGSTLSTCVTTTSIDLTTGLNGTQGIGVWTDDNATGALVGSIFNPSAAGAGTYQFSYTVGGGVNPCLFDTAIVTVVVSPQPNAGTFTGIQNVCNSAGTFDLGTLLTGEQTGGTWTDSNNVIVDALLNVTPLTAGTYNFTYKIDNSCGTDSKSVSINIISAPILTIPNITVVTPICLNENASITFSGLQDATYTINYTLSGANVQAEQASTVVIAGGVGNFTISSASIPNTGTTTITFTSITNSASNCTTALTGILVNFVVRPTSDLADANLSISNVCIGNAVIVQIAGATGLADGIYQFNYAIPNAIPSTGSTDVVTIIGGAGQFTLPFAMFSTAANYTLTITGIISLSAGCTSATENATITFEILPLPNLVAANLNAPSTCVGVANTITVSGAGNLTDGNYLATYTLSGANVGTANAVISITNGTGSFTIPADAFLNQGTVTLALTDILAGSGPCGSSGVTFAAISFEVTALETPQISEGGNEFCAADNPTVGDLSAGITGTENVIWYDAETGGTSYGPTDLLQHNQIYYASYISDSGCESATRLPVTVDLTVCEEQLLIPDGFSPNGDGINDTFEIVDLEELFPNFKLEIYNRYGSILYKGNASTPEWDGTAGEGGLTVGSNILPAGVYFYILEFNDGNREPVQGRVYLSR